MKARAGVLLLFGAALSAVSASARQNQQPPATPAPLVIQVGLDLIQIDAVITEKSGRPVADLRSEDFILEVDGRKQPISNVAWFGGATAVARVLQPSESLEAGAGEHTVVFVIDDLNMSFGSMYATRQGLARFAREMGASRPLVGLRLASAEDDKFSLFRGADRLANMASALKYNIRSSQGVSSVRGVRDPVSITTTLNRPPMSADPVSAVTPTEELQNLQQRAFSLVSTINSLRGVPGRKAVVFVSEGFYVDSRTHDRLGIDFPFGSLFDDTDISAALRMITEVANRASVVLYTVDPRGLMVDFPGASDNVSAQQASDLMRSRWNARFGSQASLQFLADDTGGLAVANRNDLKGGFADVLRDQATYYLIGFEPPEQTFVKRAGRPKFHKIKLSVNRKDVRVRTRAGYYGVTDDEVNGRAPVLATPEH